VGDLQLGLPFALCKGGVVGAARLADVVELVGKAGIAAGRVAAGDRGEEFVDVDGHRALRLCLTGLGHSRITLDTSARALLAPRNCFISSDSSTCRNTRALRKPASASFCRNSPHCAGLLLARKSSTPKACEPPAKS